MRPRSLPVLGPAIGLNLPQATTLPTHTFVSHILKPIFGCCCDLFDGSALCLCRPHKLRTKARDGTWARGVLDCQAKTDSAIAERLALQDKGVRANRRCSTSNLSWNAAARLAREWLLRLLRKVPFFRLIRLTEQCETSLGRLSL